MKTFYLLIAAVGLSVSAAFAGEAEGTIESINADDLVMTLSDGENYQLPEELDLSLIGEGMKVALAYDDVDGKKVITDMEQVD